MKHIHPSILISDFLHLGETIKMLNESEADMIHLDIMDGVFVPNLTIGFPVIKQIKSTSKKPLDVHLMIVNPDIHLKNYRDAGADLLTVHYEACIHLHRTVQEIKNLGMKAGVSLNPHTPVAFLEEILPYLDMVLIMSVNPGFGGQQFIETSIDKVIKLRKMIDEKNLNTLIEIDGGINEKNIKKLNEAGVDVFVVGNAIFSSENPKKMIRELRA
jgi:ribulose-phosphate 3-epimerase